MKKRISSLLMALCLLASLLTLPAGAAKVNRYSDVSDQTTANAAEVLRLMGVMDGYGDGSFKPDKQLNRAQFCKMTVYAMHKQGSLGLYRTVTVFPDVKPSHWAAPYINLAARTSMGGGQPMDTASGGEGGASAPVARPIIAGFPDGKFHPERVVSMGQAVTILLRVLGYQDKDIGGVWPDSYMATGAICGLTKGLPTDGNAPLTRAQAAKLFMNLLSAKTPAQSTLYTLSDPSELSGVDGGAGTIKLLDGKSFPMANPVSETSLIGMKGRVVTHDNVALTFLPDFGSGTGSASGAVVLYEDKSSVGFNALAGNGSYKIYKNGTLASIGDLRKYDVATYYPDTHSIIVCDTRLSVFYESCAPNPQEPTTIRVLGGTEFTVLPTAVDSLRELKPGDQIVLMLTVDGKVAAAEKAGGDAKGNALALVTLDGEVQLLCGSQVVPLSLKADESLRGSVVRVSSTSKGAASLDKMSGGMSGTLNVAEKKMGSQPLAEGVVIFEGGKQISLSQLDRGIISADYVRFARANWAGEVDLIVLDRGGDELFGRVYSEFKPYTNPLTGATEDRAYYGIEYGNGKRTPSFPVDYQVRAGEYAAVIPTYESKGGEMQGFAKVTRLAAIQDVSWKSWLGTTSVTTMGRTYEVAPNVLCYNPEIKEWMSLEDAMAYAKSADLYVQDGVVRAIELR